MNVVLQVFIAAATTGINIVFQVMMYVLWLPLLGYRFIVENGWKSVYYFPYFIIAIAIGLATV